jgi:transcriptional regulator with XRE-family HTH domain
MSDYATTLGDRLRAIRLRQGLTLRGVERKSDGRLHAAAVGTYERGERAVTMQKLAELLDFYDVPVAECFPATQTRPKPSEKIIINLQRLRQLPTDTMGPLVRFVTTIQSQRGKYNGQDLCIRSGDLRTLAIMYDTTPDEMTDHLNNWGLLLP